MGILDTMMKGPGGVPGMSVPLPRPGFPLNPALLMAAAGALRPGGIPPGGPLTLLHQHMTQRPIRPDVAASIDPRVQKLCDHYEIKEEKLLRLLDHQVHVRPETIDGDIESLYEVLKNARSPPALLMVKIKEMQDGTFVGKIAVDKEIEDVAQKFKLDDQAKTKLMEGLAKHSKDRKKDLENLVSHLECSNKPSAMVMIMLSKMRKGEEIEKCKHDPAPGSYKWDLMVKRSDRGDRDRRDGGRDRRDGDRRERDDRDRYRGDRDRRSRGRRDRRDSLDRRSRSRSRRRDRRSRSRGRSRSRRRSRSRGSRSRRRSRSRSRRSRSRDRSRRRSSRRSRSRSDRRKSSSRSRDSGRGTSRSGGSRAASRSRQRAPEGGDKEPSAMSTPDWQLAAQQWVASCQQFMPSGVDVPRTSTLDSEAPAA